MFNWQGKRKKCPVKNVNILKLMTLKTNGLSNIFTVFQFSHTHTRTHTDTTALSDHFSRNIFVFIRISYTHIVTGTSIVPASMPTDCNTQSTLQTNESFLLFTHEHRHIHIWNYRRLWPYTIQTETKAKGMKTIDPCIFVQILRIKSSNEKKRVILS